MLSFLLSTKRETAFVSGSDTGPVPQNVKSWQFSEAPVSGIDRKPRRRQHDSRLEQIEGKASPLVRATCGWQRGLPWLVEVSSG